MTLFRASSPSFFKCISKAGFHPRSPSPLYFQSLPHHTAVRGRETIPYVFTLHFKPQARAQKPLTALCGIKESLLLFSSQIYPQGKAKIPPKSQHPVPTSRNWFSKGSHLYLWCHSRSSPKFAFHRPRLLTITTQLWPMLTIVMDPEKIGKLWKKTKVRCFSSFCWARPLGFSDPTRSLHLAYIWHCHWVCTNPSCRHWQKISPIYRWCILASFSWFYFLLGKKPVHFRTHPLVLFLPNVPPAPAVLSSLESVIISCLCYH